MFSATCWQKGALAASYILEKKTAECCLGDEKWTRQVWHFLKSRPLFLTVSLCKSVSAYTSKPLSHTNTHGHFSVCCTCCWLCSSGQQRPMRENDPHWTSNVPCIYSFYHVSGTLHVWNNKKRSFLYTKQMNPTVVWSAIIIFLPDLVTTLR